MGEELKINIKIGEKEFPIMIDKNEEELYRKAQKFAQDIFIQYRESYRETPVEDLYVMVIFALAKKYIDLQEKKESISIFTELSDIVVTLEEYLKAQ